jgi:hypothetical protein
MTIDTDGRFTKTPLLSSQSAEIVGFVRRNGVWYNRVFAKRPGLTSH